MKTEQTATRRGTGGGRKPPKVPARFRKPIAEKAFEKRFARMLEQKDDVEFFRSCFALDGGAYSLRQGLGPGEAKRLGRLAKAIKANRGVFKAGPILALILVVVGAAVFGLFFMNPLLEKAVEGALSAAFGAKAEVEGLRFSPFGMTLSARAVAVADRDAPMTNLFETGPIALSVDPAAAFRGRVFIREAIADSLAVGTPRSASGALAGSPAREGAAAREKPAAPPLVDFERFDAAALLEREKSRLASTAAYGRAGAAYDEAAVRWTARAASSGAAVKQLEASTRSVLAIDPKGLTKAEDVARAIADAKAAIQSVQSASREAAAVSQGITAGAATLAGLEKAARAALADDLGYLKALVDPGSGAAMAALEPSVREILSDGAERYLYYARRAYETFVKLRAGAPAKEKARPAGPSAYKGRDVYFPSAGYPAFRLGLLRSSFSAGGKDWLFELRDVSTEPALVPDPSAMKLDVAAASWAVGLSATLDLRGEGAAPWNGALTCRGLPVDLGDALADAGLPAFSAELSGGGDMGGDGPDSFRAELDLSLSRVRTDGATGVFGAAVAQALAASSAVEATIGYERSPGSADRFTLATNIDTIVSRALAAVAGKYAAKATAELETAVRAYAADELEGKLASKEELNDAIAAAKGDGAAVGRIQAGLEQKLKDLEARAQAIGAGALQGLGIPGLGPTKKP